LQNGFGNFAGLIGPALTGFVLDKTGGLLHQAASSADEPSRAPWSAQHQQSSGK
jgi:hypothetical protein